MSSGSASHGASATAVSQVLPRVRRGKHRLPTNGAETKVPAQWLMP